MTIKEQLAIGSAWYGWGTTVCDDCSSIHGTAILHEINKGEYEIPSLTHAQIEQLRQTARSHQKNGGSNHSIRVLIYQRGED